MSRFFGFALCLAAGSGMLFAQCEVSVPVRQLLDKPEFRRKIVETQDQREARLAAFKKAQSEFPDNYFVLRAQLRGFEARAEGLAWAKEQRRQHPDSLAYQLVEADALAGIDTPEAIRRLEALKKAHPEEARVYLQLAGTHGFGKFRDKDRVHKELDGYINLCPGSTDGTFLDTVLSNGSPAQIAATAAALRKRLEGDTGEVQRARWENLWSLEFKAHPLAEHPAVRKKIGEDLARFEQSPKRKEATWMTFLRSGYQSMGDQAAIDRIAAEIVETHPKSNEAKRVVQERWRKEHPFPRENEGQIQEWRNIELDAAREWHLKWPDDATILLTIVFDVIQDSDAGPEQIETAVDEFQAAYRKNPEFLTKPPFEFRIADAYIKHMIRLDQVPAMVEQSAQRAAADDERMLEDDRNDEQTVTMMRSSVDYTQMERARLLVSCYTLTKEPAKAKAVVENIKLLEPSKQKSTMLALKGKLAEAENRKADALALYRAALNARTTPLRAGVKDALTEDLQRLWKETGGTPEGYSIFMEKPKTTETATDTRWEKPKNPLPPFTLADMQGKTWKLTSLEGKALLINIWATWCGPCVAEHPEFQKLYDKLKDRTDVSVLSFNVDEDLGKVAPYIAEHKYTFPVMPAKDVVDAVVPMLAIPRNWLVTAKGKLEWEQIGFGSEPKWQEMMLAKLEEVIKAK